jgi:phage/plasmid-like protein (TIGR03299 family)
METINNQIVKPKVWQVLGKTITQCKTSAEAIQAAGLDFEVMKRPNIHPLPSGNNIISDNSYFTFRTDTEAVLGDKIGRDYEVVQNIDQFAFFDSIVENYGGLHYESAGSLAYGQTTYITAKLPEHIKVGKSDLIEQYLFLTSTHDGTGSMTIAFTPVRIYCSNTLNAALKNCTNAIKIRHTASAAEKLKSAHQLLGLTSQLSVELEAIFNRWARVRITDPEVKRLIQLAMIPNRETYDKLKAGKDEELSSHFNNTVSGVFDYYHTGDSQQENTTKGTLFGMYNAVTGYYQNVRNYGDNEAKFKSIMTGTGLQRNQSAFDLCDSFARHGNRILQFN